MEVLIYQIVIACIILISGYSGIRTKNITTIILILFTLTHVFMPWLMILQFITIGISYSVATATTRKKLRSTKNVANTESNGLFDWVWKIFGGLIIIIVIFLILRSIIAMIGVFTGWYEMTGWFTIS